MPVPKNKPVGTHAIDMLLSCGCIHVEPIEAAIFTPSIGESRSCNKHVNRKDITIAKIGTPYWLDLEKNQDNKK